jgi:hypothetical protein
MDNSYVKKEIKACLIEINDIDTNWWLDIDRNTFLLKNFTKIFIFFEKIKFNKDFFSDIIPEIQYLVNFYKEELQQTTNTKSPFQLFEEYLLNTDKLIPSPNIIC